MITAIGDSATCRMAGLYLQPPAGAWSLRSHPLKMFCSPRPDKISKTVRRGAAFLLAYRSYRGLRELVSALLARAAQYLTIFDHFVQQDLQVVALHMSDSNELGHA
jgi:hypothetical protein